MKSIKCESFVNIRRKCTVPLLVRQRRWTPHRFSWPWRTASRSSLCSCSPHRPNRKQCFLHCTQMPGTLWKRTAPLWRNMKKTLDDPDSFHSTVWEQCAFILAHRSWWLEFTFVSQEFMERPFLSVLRCQFVRFLWVARDIELLL